MQPHFAHELLLAGYLPHISQNPFVRAVADGQYPKEGLHTYAQEVRFLAGQFIRQLAAVLALCDDVGVRQLILENLLEEEGAVSFGAATGLVFDPARRHAALADRFLDALGIGYLETTPPGSQWLAEELQAGRWLGAFTYLCVGIEVNVPVTFRVMITGLRQHYGFQEHELAFFTEHFEADERHSAHGAAVAAAAATTEAARQEALLGAQRGAQSWWHLHLKHARRLRHYKTAHA